MKPADYWKQVREAHERYGNDECRSASDLTLVYHAFPLALARIEELEAALDTRTKASAAWEGLFNERTRLGRDYGDKLDAIGGLISDNGCDCECDHDFESHDDDCERCLACRVSTVLGK